MILGSWPFSDDAGDEPLVLYAEVRSETMRVIEVHVKRGAVRLTGGEDGHILRFQLGFWEVTEPAPVAAFHGSRRMNAIEEMVVAALTQDLRRYGRSYEIPREDLLAALSKDSMKRLDLMVEIMGS